MAWDFSTEPEFEEKLDWMRSFVTEEILPLETLGLDADALSRATAPLKEEVKAQGLWASHLPPELGGGGFGQVRLALMHEVLGRSRLAPPVFGNQAPDSGNAELLALGGTDEQKRRWMDPLLDGQLVSSFSMTEPGAGADPTLLSTTATPVDGGWEINGDKWFSTNASAADFLIVMALTDPDAPVHQRYSMFIVPSGTPGVDIKRDVPTMLEPEPVFGEPGGHGEVAFRGARVSDAELVGGPEGRGQGFALAQKRLGPGRIHHCMRWLGQCHRAFDMLCERAVSRWAHGSTLSDKQMVQDWVASSAAEIQAARLMTLHAAWRMDQVGAKAARVDISMIKYFGAKVLYDVIDRAIQIHGALGYTADLPLEEMYRRARAARIYDGPDEVHKVTVARSFLSKYEPTEVPTEHVPTRRADAQQRFAEMLVTATDNL